MDDDVQTAMHPDKTIPDRFEPTAAPLLCSHRNSAAHGDLPFLLCPLSPKIFQANKRSVVCYYGLRRT